MRTTRLVWERWRGVGRQGVEQRRVRERESARRRRRGRRERGLGDFGEGISRAATTVRRRQRMRGRLESRARRMWRATLTGTYRET